MSEIYRQTQLGQALEEALEITEREIDPSMAKKVREHFDEVRKYPRSELCLPCGG